MVEFFYCYTQVNIFKYNYVECNYILLFSFYIFFVFFILYNKKIVTPPQPNHAKYVMICVTHISSNEASSIVCVGSGNDERQSSYDKTEFSNISIIWLERGQLILGKLFETEIVFEKCWVSQTTCLWFVTILHTLMYTVHYIAMWCSVFVQYILV